MDHRLRVGGFSSNRALTDGDRLGELAHLGVILGQRVEIGIAVVITGKGIEQLVRGVDLVQSQVHGASRMVASASVGFWACKCCAIRRDSGKACSRYNSRRARSRRRGFCTVAPRQCRSSPRLPAAGWRVGLDQGHRDLFVMWSVVHRFQERDRVGGAIHVHQQQRQQVAALRSSDWSPGGCDRRRSFRASGKRCSARYVRASRIAACTS